MGCGRKIAVGKMGARRADAQNDQQEPAGDLQEFCVIQNEMGDRLNAVGGNSGNQHVGEHRAEACKADGLLRPVQTFRRQAVIIYALFPVLGLRAPGGGGMRAARMNWAVRGTMQPIREMHSSR